MWRASVLTIFPEMFPGPLRASLAGKALAAGIWSLETLDIRAHAADRHRTVDDTPAGGGPGMVMKADVVAKALDAVPRDTRPRLLMSPRGRPLTQRRVSELAHGNGVVVLCARFEGVDERLIAARGLEEVSKSKPGRFPCSSDGAASGRCSVAALWESQAAGFWSCGTSPTIRAGNTC